MRNSTVSIKNNVISYATSMIVPINIYEWINSCTSVPVFYVRAGNDIIVVTCYSKKPLEKTKSGILLGEAKEKPAYAVVESVGPEVKSVKKGDKIVYKEYSTTEIKVDGKDYIIVKEEDILATL